MSLKSNTLKTGLAAFAMFFGAGNVVFPLAVGLQSQDANIFGILGLILTAVLVPFLGLIAAILFKGDYEAFFERLGKWPGFILIVLILALIGPFGALPRTITLSFATTRMFYPSLSLIFFSLVAHLLIFVLTVRKNQIVDVIGTILTPLLLGSLAIIIIKGILTGGPAAPSTMTGAQAFFYGLKEGYQTMDLLATPFFSTVIVSAISISVIHLGDTSQKAVIKESLKASLIGAIALTATYVGFGLLAAKWGGALAQKTPDTYLGTLAIEILGPYAGIVACIAVALACLTTAMALAAVFADFLERDIFKERLGYGPCLILTLLISFLFSTLEFTGIMAFLAPILIISYPALITLCIVNILYKLYGFKWVITPTLAVFLATLAVEFSDLVF